MNSLPHSETIKQEAALWAARFDGGGLTDADRQALSRWLQTPEHLEALSRLRQLSASLEPKLPGIFESIELRETSRSRRRNRLFLPALSALAASLILVFLFRPTGQTYETRPGERRIALLSDGTRLTLNAQSSVRVVLRKQKREVTLEHGEALFHVAKDLQRPFRVHTPAGLVQVTGTVFNVRTGEPLHAEVTVLEGTVEVQPDKDAQSRRALTVDTQADLRPDGVSVQQLAAGGAEQVAAWQEGRVIFDSTPLAAAMKRYESYHGWTIEVAPEIADLRLGGRYNLENIEELLRSLPRALPVQISRSGTRVRIYPQETLSR